MTVAELVTYIGMYNPMHGNVVRDLYYDIHCNLITLYFRYAPDRNFRISLHEEELAKCEKAYVKTMFDDILEKLRKGEI